MVIQFETMKGFKECINLYIKCGGVDFATDAQNLKITVYNMCVGKKKIEDCKPNSCWC